MIFRFIKNQVWISYKFVWTNQPINRWIDFKYHWFLSILEDWILVNKKKECSGSEEDKGPVVEISQCAEKCRAISSMFIFGTNEYVSEDDSRCEENGCDCYCEIDATSDGNCDMKDHDSYNLYKFVNWVAPGKWYEILIDDLINSWIF